MTWWQAEFPLDEGIAYLNHAAVGVWPRRTARAVCDFARENIRRGAADYPRWLTVERGLRERLAALIGASPTDVALVGSTSDALSIVAQGLDWRRGDEVVIPAGEFPSNRMVWEALADRGVRLREVDVACDDPEAALMAACSARTRLVSVSSVQYATGLRLDLARLGRFCREQGIVFCVDAIQSLGTMRMDVNACLADVVAADAHKWMLGPEGIALLFVREGLRSRLKLLRHGWHMVERAGDFEARDWRPAASARRFEPGSPNMLGIHALNASLSLLLDIGLADVERMALERARRLIRLLDEAGRFALLTPRGEGRFAGIVTVRRVESARCVAGVSKASYYRWRDRLRCFGPKGLEPRSRRPRRVRCKQWSLELVLAVKRLRLRYGWGKEKLTPLLRAQGFEVSESTVGRILSHLLRRGEVPLSPAFQARGKARRRSRARRVHAMRMPKGFKARLPGDLVQIDTVTVSPFPGLTVKQFTAVDVVSRWKVQCIYSRATSRCARKALEEVLAEMPFPVRHVQVDGGSEFKGEFEEACREKGLPLFVLPPRSPKLNGHVERANGTDRYEFYCFYEVGSTIAEVRKAAKKCQHIYNHIRPHKALNLSTPASYLARLNRKSAA